MRQRGFTLIEILVALPITVIIMATAFWLWWDFLRGSQATVDYGIAVDATEASVSQFMREIRSAQVSETGAYPLITLEDFAVAFYADVDNDGIVERVDYLLEADLLVRRVTEPTGEPAVYPQAYTQSKTLVAKVINDGTPLFLYYDSNWPKDAIGNPLVPAYRLLGTRLITFTVRVSVDRHGEDAVIQSARSVTIRELKTNK